MDRKIVLDTNVLLFDALAIQKFRNADLYIPMSVIEEIDRFKRDLGENGRARQFSRFIDVLKKREARRCFCSRIVALICM